MFFLRLGREKILDSLKKDLEANIPFCRASFGSGHIIAKNIFSLLELMNH